MANASHVKFILSGGASNTTPGSALGGAISTQAGATILSQSITASTISGVTYDDAAGNATGTGTVTYTASGTLLQWTSPGGAIGPAVSVGTSGSYTVYANDGVGHVKVTTVAGSLPGGNTSQTPTIGHQANKLFDDLSRADGVAGSTEYRCFYVKNTHGTDTMTAVKLWIGSDASGADAIALGLDPAGKNGTATTIANDTTAPAGVTFSTPADETSALSIGNLSAGDYYPVWIRRSLPASNEASTATDLAALKLRFQ